MNGERTGLKENVLIKRGLYSLQREEPGLSTGEYMEEWTEGAQWGPVGGGGSRNNRGGPVGSSWGRGVQEQALSLVNLKHTKYCSTSVQVYNVIIIESHIA